MKHITGSLEVITGSMFSGKTDELIRRLRRARIARQKVQVFKPRIDNRYAHRQSDLARRQRITTPRPSSTRRAILEPAWTPDTTVVAIDEAQFFDAASSRSCNSLADRGLRVIVAGLDTDFRGEPFGPMPTLMAMAEVVDKLHAICVVCGEPASRTQRLINGKPARYNDPVVIVGASGDV